MYKRQWRYRRPLVPGAEEHRAHSKWLSLIHIWVISDDEVKERYAARQPYGEWLDRNLVKLKELPIPNHRVERASKEQRARLQKAFGYTYEDVRNTILPMARTGAVSYTHLDVYKRQAVSMAAARTAVSPSLKE